MDLNLYLKAVLVFQILQVGRGSLDEERLLQDLFSKYNPAARPTLNDTDTVNVTFGLSLNQLVNVHEKSQIMVMSAFTRQIWLNPILTWDPAKYNNIQEINVDPKKIWRPDIVLYNNADEDKTFGGNLDRLNTRVILNYTGVARWLAPIIFKSKCDIDVQYFPFDTQECSLKFGSWTYDESRLDLWPEESQAADRDKYSANSAWLLKSAIALRNVTKYTCCPKKFPDVTFTIVLARRSLFYVVNLIFPMVLIGMLEILSFLLPAESGERISLAITLLLAMTVFMLVVAEIIPATSEVVPLVGIYFIASMGEMVIMIVALCYIMRLYHKGPTDPPMSIWARRIVLDWLSYIVRIRVRTPTQVELKAPTLNVQNSLHLNNEETNQLLEKFKLNTPNSPQWLERKLKANHCLISGDNIPNIINNNRISHRLEATEKVIGKLDVLINHLRSMDEEDAIRTEWRVVAMTIDRCLLIFFTIVFLITVIGCFSYAPGYVS